MPTDAGQGPVDEHLQRFAEYVAAQPGHDLSYDDLARSTTRAELGIGSLDMLILVAGYIETVANGAVALQPEWVPLLDDVPGIRSVLVDIDAAAAQSTAS